MTAPTLAVWLRGQHVANLTEVRSRQLSLRWAAPALEQWPIGSIVLSARLPVRERPFSVGETRPYVEGLLPEGEKRDLLHAADTALDDAKRDGRDRVRVGPGAGGGRPAPLPG